MKHQRSLAAISLLGALTIACEAQSVTKSGDPGGVPPVRAGADGKPGAPGEKPEKRAKGPTEITAREATFDNRTHFATFTGDVVVKDPEFNVTCDQMTVYLKKPPEKNAPKDNQKPAANPGPPIAADPAPAANPKAEGDAASGIEKAIAEGNVVITQDKLDADGKPQRYTGRGKKAVFEDATGNVTLTGWPQISQSIGGSMSKQTLSREESCVIVINRAGKIHVTGYHTTTLHDASAAEQSQR